MLKVLLALALVATASATIAPGCTTCAAGSAPNAADTDGCTPCGTITNAHAGAVVTCSVSSGSTLDTNSLDLIADPVSGFKCASGFSYTAPATGDSAAAANCDTACIANCAQCTGATAAACTHAVAGYFRDAESDGALTACASLSDDSAGDWGNTCETAADKDNTPKTATVICPANNTLTAVPTAAADVCSACADGEVNSTGTSKDCVACGTITGAATDAVVSCAAENGTLTDFSTTLAAGDDSGRQCEVGKFYTAATESAEATCGSCISNCDTCTANDLAGCTSVAAGYFKGDSAISPCTPGDFVTDCDELANGKQDPMTAAELCPAGNAVSADPATGEARCQLCPAGTGKSLMSDATPPVSTGCQDCTVLTNTANGATLTCDNDGTLEANATSTVDIVAAPAGSGDCVGLDGTIDNSEKGTQALCEAVDNMRWSSTEGRKCAYGYFYTGPVAAAGDTAAANASCTACETGCYVCTATEPGNCSVHKEGYWMGSSTPAACTALTSSATGSCLTSPTLKVAVTANAACPFGNLCTGAPSTDDIDSTCPSPSPGVDAAGATAPGAFAAAVAAVIVALRM